MDSEVFTDLVVKSMNTNVILKSELIIPKDSTDPLDLDEEQISDFNLSFTLMPVKEHACYVYLNVSSCMPFTAVWTCKTSSGKNYASHFETDGRGSIYFPSKLFSNDDVKINSVVTVTSISMKARRWNDSHIDALLDDEEFKDFALSVDGKEIKVHKSIIAVASPVFAAMLKPHCKEFKDGKVVIEDFDYETVEAAVNLMYTREVDSELPITILLNLYKFADKYDFVDT
uniref:BTB domain-containing protein n=1 Tax=Panagrolaimus sp. JU765 TaxID=591449 RepID=A0AC34PV82_9BILA